MCGGRLGREAPEFGQFHAGTELDVVEERIEVGKIPLPRLPDERHQLVETALRNLAQQKVRLDRFESVEQGIAAAHGLPSGEERILDRLQSQEGVDARRLCDGLRRRRFGGRGVV